MIGKWSKTTTPGGDKTAKLDSKIRAELGKAKAGAAAALGATTGNDRSGSWWCARQRRRRQPQHLQSADAGRPRQDDFVRFRRNRLADEPIAPAQAVLRLRPRVVRDDAGAPEAVPDVLRQGPPDRRGVLGLRQRRGRRAAQGWHDQASAPGLEVGRQAVGGGGHCTLRRCGRNGEGSEGEGVPGSEVSICSA